MRTHLSISLPLLAVAMCGLAGCSDQVTGPGTVPQFSNVGAAGPLQTWGDDSYNQLSGTPAGDVTAASAGGYHSVAIRSDGTLVSWGRNDFSQVSSTPAGTFTAVAGGFLYSVAIRSNGTLVAWGDDSDGQVSGIPSGTFTAVDAGDGHSVAIRSPGPGAGTLVSWGLDAYAEVSGTPGGTFTAVAAGGFHSVALAGDGTLVSWGNDGFGQVSGTPGGTFTAVAAGLFHNVAIRSDGTLVSWGWDFYGQVSGTPAGTFTAVSAGDGHSVAIRSDGTLVSWGLNADNQVGGTPAGIFSAVDAGGYHSVAIAGPAGPTAPTNLRATLFSSTQIALAWTDGSNDEVDFSLQRRQKAPAGVYGAYAEIVRPVANSTNYNDTGLTADYTYQYRIRACNAVGCSAYATSSAVLLQTPAAPTNVQTVQKGPLNARTTWTDASKNENSFQVHRRIRNPDNSFTSWGLLATTGANAHAFNDATVSTGIWYQYQVAACNSAGCSVFVVGPLVTIESLPAAPTGLTATPTSSTNIDVTWTDASTNEAGFSLGRRTKVAGVFGGWEEIAQPTANTAFFSDTGRSPSTTYQYRIRACNAAGCSTNARSNQATTGI